MSVDVGDVQRLTYRHTDAVGNLVSAGSMELVVTRPDGTVTTVGPITATSVGAYRHDYVTEQAGRHTVRWVGAGENPGAYTDVFDVWEPDPGFLVSLQSARLHANLDPDDSTEDAELRPMISAATVLVEEEVGPVLVREYSEVHRGGPLIVLHRAPVLSVQSMAPVLTGGTTYAPAEVDVDPATGIVRLLDSTVFRGPLRVTYTAGRRVVPSNITEAVKIVTGHMWNTQRGAAPGRPGMGDDDMPAVGMGFLIPRRAMELLAPHRRAPVLA